MVFWEGFLEGGEVWKSFFLVWAQRDLKLVCLFVCLFVCFVVFCFVLLCFVVFCCVLFCFVLFCLFVCLFCFVLFVCLFVCSLVVEEINASSSLEIVEGQRFIAVSRNSCSNDCPREFDYLFDKCSIVSFILFLPKTQLPVFLGGCDVPFSGSNLPKVWAIWIKFQPAVQPKGWSSRTMWPKSWAVWLPFLHERKR